MFKFDTTMDQSFYQEHDAQTDQLLTVTTQDNKHFTVKVSKGGTGAAVELGIISPRNDEEIVKVLQVVVGYYQMMQLMSFVVVNNLFKPTPQEGVSFYNDQYEQFKG